MLGVVPSSIINAIAERESGRDWDSAVEVAKEYLRDTNRAERRRNNSAWIEYMRTGCTNRSLVRG